MKNDKRTIFGWAMYDWANSAYVTTSGAIVAPFFTGTMIPDEGVSILGATVSGETLWAAVVSFGAMMLFLAMPILGAVADFASAKRTFLRFFAFLGAGFTVLLLVVPAGGWLLFLALFIITQIGFVGANVFYDGFLPDISTDDTVDKISSKGYALGYVGGGVYLALGLVVLLVIGDDGIMPRLVIAGAGVWWFFFSLFALSRLPEIGEAEELPAEYRSMSRARAMALIGFRRTVATTRKLRSFPMILLFIVAYMFYNDGTQTVINISGAYAEDTLNLEITEVAIAFLIVQFVAYGGALFFGMLAGRIGAKRSILVSLVVWTGLAIAAYFLPEGEALPFFALAAVVGLVLGGVQALSRSLYSTMVPEAASAEFFGFFTVFSKFSAIWGPLIFAGVSAATGSGRPAILSVVAFFIIGGILLSRVDIEAAQASRDEWDFHGAEV